MKLNEMALANASAILTGGFYLVCRLLAGIAPDLLRAIGQSWFHTYDLSTIPVADLGFGLTLVGFLTAVGLGWLTGYLLAWVYNKLAK